MVPEINWKEEVNKLTGPFPEVGMGAPQMELLEVKKSKLKLEGKGQFSKLSTEIFFFVDKQTGKTYTMQKHWLTEYGEVSLREALIAVKKDK